MAISYILIILENPGDRRLGITTVGFCHFWEIAGNTRDTLNSPRLPKYWLND